jgi:16S rRNA processing protein RimM
MNLIAIGKCAKPIGTRGEIKIVPLTDDTKRFQNLQSVWVGHDETRAKSYSVTSVRVEAQQVVLRLQGITSSEQAGELRNTYIFLPQEKTVMLRAGSYFMDDVLECEVVTEEQVLVGRVTDILSLPANDVWVVRKDTKEILIPAVKEIIRKVDVKMKRITIHALEGLLE